METLKKACNILIDIKTIKNNNNIDMYINDTLNNYYNDIVKMLYNNTLNVIIIEEIKKNINKLKKDFSL